MAKRKVGNRHDAMAEAGKHMVKTNAHKKGHLAVKVGKKSGGRKRSGKKTMLCG